MAIKFGVFFCAYSFDRRWQLRPLCVTFDVKFHISSDGNHDSTQLLFFNFSISRLIRRSGGGGGGCLMNIIKRLKLAFNSGGSGHSKCETSGLSQ